MKWTTILTAALLAVLPATGIARQCSDKSAVVCETGFVWDEETQACVKMVSS